MVAAFRRMACAAVLVMVAACSSEPHEAEKLVAQLYREHDAQRSPFFQTARKELVDRYFEPSLAELIWKDAVDANGEVGALDFDPLYDGQDVEPRNLIVHAAQSDGAMLLVPVSFDSHGTNRQVTY